MRAAVVAHTSRAAHAYPLAQQLNASLLIDDGSLGGKANHIRAWNTVKQDSGWSLVCEDDTILCTDFMAHLERALEGSPSPVLSLYLGTSYPPHLVGNARRALERAEEAGERYCILPTLNHAVAVVMRSELIPDMLEHVSALRSPIDDSITHWVKSREIPVAYTVPSLVDHRDDETVTQHPDGVKRTRPRKAVRFAG